MNSLTPFQKKTVSAVQGYFELGMCREALSELRTLPSEIQNEAPVQELEIVILIRARRWPSAVRVAKKFCKTNPNLPAGFIHLAYCQHELGDTVSARKTLLSGPPALEKEGTYFYNLACYDAVLGDIEAARRNLAKSIRIDKRFRDFAKTDHDLASLHMELQ